MMQRGRVRTRQPATRRRGVRTPRITASLQGNNVLILHRAGVRRGSEAVLKGVSLQAQSPGLLFVVGSGGAGKSSLFAALAGVAGDTHFQLSGTAELDGVPIGAGATHIGWVPQHARLEGEGSCRAALQASLGGNDVQVEAWLEQRGLAQLRDALAHPLSALPDTQRRALAVMTALEAPAQLYLVDEPTAALDETQTAAVRRRLQEIAADSMVVVATHNRQDCLALGGHTALLAGGAIQEHGPSARFFAQPQTAAGRVYVDTGNCNLPHEARAGRMVDGMWWIVPGLLCGMSRPGLMANADHQYRKLWAQGVRRIICLEERCEYPLAPLQAVGLLHWNVGVRDMTPPSFNQAVDLCRWVDEPIRNNEGVALHCRAGLGRTGTALAAILIWFGDAAEAAIAKVRRAQPLAIQSLAQSRFLHDFADRIRGWH